LRPFPEPLHSLDQLSDPSIFRSERHALTHNYADTLAMSYSEIREKV